MKKKIMTVCSLLIVFSLAFAFVSSGKGLAQSNVSTAVAEIYAAENEESTTSAVGNIVGDAVSGIGSGAADVLGGLVSDVAGDIGSGSGSLGSGLGDLGGFDGSGIVDGIGGAFSGIVDGFGGILGGLGGNSSPEVTYDNSYIDPVPAATQDYTPVLTQPGQTQVIIQQVPAPETTHGATVDYALTANPYEKPDSDFVAGDEGEGVKWLQWIFIYTRFGLRDDGITGVMDADTVAVVKKLQQEKGLTVDGNVNADVISAAEVLFYEYSFGATETLGEISSVVTEPVSQSGSGNTYGTAAIIAVVIAIIWIIAIVVILILFIFKKKKKGKKSSSKIKKNESSDKPSEAKAENSGAVNFGEMSLSDLFEEANNK